MLTLASLVMARESKDDDRPLQVRTIAEAKLGETVLVATGEGLDFFLRIPENYDRKVGARLIVFLHGSNMNGLTYLRSFEARKWCEDDILVCPNGEQGDDPFDANNFTFASAPLVSAVTRLIQSAMKVRTTYVGGHSQGGFLTYAVFLGDPDLYQGAFPMAGDCWMQNEPNLWEDDPAMLARQRKVAIAIIHGRADPVVDFSAAEHAYGIFRAMAYPKLALFAPEELGHQFMLAPVDEALEWLDAMQARDQARSVELLAEWAKAGEWGWVTGGALAIQALPKASAEARKTAKGALAAAETRAKEELPAMSAAMSEQPARDWVPHFFEWRRQHGSTGAAASLINRYDELRQKQRTRGADLFARARAAFNSDDRAGGDALLEQLLEDAPACFHAYYAVTWLASR